MRSFNLQFAIDRLAVIAAEHDCVLLSELSDGASIDGLRELEDFVGGPLAPSLRKFLELHDGLSLTFVRIADHKRYRFPINRYRFQVYGSKDIKQSTIDMREYISGIEIYDHELHRRSLRCISFATSFDTSDDRIVFSLDAHTSKGEYGILHADLVQWEWLDVLRDGAGGEAPFSTGHVA